MGKRYTAEGIILSKMNYGEGDKILNLFVQGNGRTILLANGVRKIISRKRGAVEVFNYVKFSASRGKGMDVITEVETIDDFAGVRMNLTKIAVAYFFMEVVLKLVREGEENEELFTVLLKYLNTLNVSSRLKQLRSEFVYEVLTVLGYWPQGKPLPNPDMVLQDIAEREIVTLRVGKQIIQA